MVKLKTVSLCFFAFVVLTLNGCAIVGPIQPRPTQLKHVYYRNYDLNKELTAYVGMEIVRVKDYYVSIFETNKLRASNDFSVKVNSFLSYNGRKNEEFNLVGQIEQNEGIQYLICLPGLPYFRFCINQDGTMSRKVIGEMNQKTTLSHEIVTPINTKFVSVLSEEIAEDKDFTSYELIFTGISESNINLLYREYTPQDMARQAYYQNLTYPIKSNTIRFKNTLISVTKINQEGIVYKVVSDGLPNEK